MCSGCTFYQSVNQRPLSQEIRKIECLVQEFWMQLRLNCFARQRKIDKTCMPNELLCFSCNTNTRPVRSLRASTIKLILKKNEILQTRSRWSHTFLNRFNGMLRTLALSVLSAVLFMFVVGIGG